MAHPPDRRRLEHDLLAGPYQIGLAAGHWGRPDDPAGGMPWPAVPFWVAAAPRPNAPDRYHLLLDCQGYPTASPTGTFRDAAGNPLPPAAWPKGKGQVAKVFRTDWENGRALYHPFDRVASGTHADWPTAYPHLVWDGTRTIVDLLSVIHGLLNGTDYTGT